MSGGTVPSVDARVGTELAGYRVEALLGRGGMASVYRAVDPRLERNVALKLLAADLADDATFRDRFLQESRLAASLDHPHVAPIYEAGESEGHLYIAMRFVEGSDLKRVLESEGALAPERALDLLEPVADGLDAAHARGLVHRDVKPGNVLIGLDGHVYLSDFGLTKRAGSALALTRTGQFVGTAEYVPPEQIAGGKLDGRADQYSLACVLFECLTGSPPFEREEFMAVLWAHVNDKPPSANGLRSELPAAIDAVLARALNKPPDERYANCRELIAEARRALGVAPREAETLPGGTVTFLFTDIEGSTRLLRQLGDSYAEALLNHHRLLADVFAKHGGRVVDTQGDAFFAAFARAKDAVVAALDVQRALAAQSWPDGAELRVRIGLHSGEPRVEGDRYVGLAVHRGARIAAAARGGQILLSSATRQLLEDAQLEDVSFGDLGEHELKDFDRPERIFELRAQPEEDAAAGPEFRMLGPFDVRAHRDSVDLGGPKPRALLAVLLLRAGEVVSADRLIDELWGEAPPKSANHLLHVYVSTLRKALAPVLEEAQQVLMSRAPGYALDVDPDTIDARRFDRLLGEGRRLLAAGDAAGASKTLRNALALWRGAALADFTYEPFAQSEIARLEELRLVALEERIAADLALARHQELAGELEGLVAEHPLRERLREQQMLALYRSGRQADALEVYRETRGKFVDELGIEPSRSLKDLEQAILRRDASLEITATAAPAQVALQAGRKLVTVLAASVVDSPELDALDAEARSGVVAQALEPVTAALVRHGAAVERLGGETLIGAFGIPAANEDDALRAARAAAEARDGIAAANAELERDWGVRITVAIGIETGEVVAGEGTTPAALSGDAMARAVRLSYADPDGQILLGETTYGLVRHATLAEADPATPARGGLAGRRRLLAVLDEAPTVARRLDSPLVGREPELAQLGKALERARRDSALRLVTVVGEAGVGKSRLAQEFLAEADATALVGRCIAYGDGITFWPLKEVVQQAAGEETREALLSLLGAEPDAAALADRILAAIGGAEPAGAREETFWAFRKLLETVATARPVVLLLDDLHWGEPTLLDLVEYLADWTRGAPVLLLGLARPQLLEERPSLAAGRAGAATITLEPLGHEEAQELVANLAGGSPLPAEACTRIVVAAEGNPLFLEQLLAMLAEEGESQDELAVPLTIRAVLAARLERLGPAERAVLERASVAGKEFWEGAVEALLPVEARPSLRRHLETLVHKGFVRPDHSTLPGQEGLRIAHALVQEVAYRAISKEVRAELHERLAGWLEGALGERVEDYEAIVGYHLEQAFRYREELRAIDGHARGLAGRASDRLASAGRKALAWGDPHAAANLVGRAAALVEDEPAKRLALLPELVEALRELPDLPRAAAVAEAAVEAAVAAGEERSELLARIERAHVRLLGSPEGAVEEAVAEAERAIEVFDATQDDLGLAKAWRLIAMTRRLMGRQSARREALERALVHVLRVGDRRTEAWIMDGLGGVHTHGPSPVEELRRFAEESVRWAREHGQRFGEAHGLAQGHGRAAAMLGEFDAAREAVGRGRAIVEELGFPWHRAGIASAAGFVELLAGDPEAAERELREGLAVVEDAGMTGSYFGMALRDELAEVLYVQGRYAEAGQLAETAERDAGPDDVQAQVLWRAIRGKVRAREARFEEAEALAREAVGLAEQTEFTLVHGNALRDLAEVLQLAGRPTDAAVAARAALDLYLQKGNRVAAERMRARLGELDQELSSPAATGR